MQSQSDVVSERRRVFRADDRVRAHTAEQVNNAIDLNTESMVRYFSGRSSREISLRLAELDREWDIERAFEAVSSSLSLAGLVFGLAWRRRYLMLTALSLAFLFQHALKGWCPPMPLLRRIGFRSRREIDREKMALKAVRGDFEGLRPGSGDGGAEGRGGKFAEPVKVLEAVDRN